MEGSFQHGIDCCERLIRAVGRAFYSDSVVVVLDALVSERYIPERELPVRLKLREKEVARVISQLQRERLIHVEEVDGTRLFYIDYQAFANVCRLRVYLMQKTLRDNEDRNIHFRCPTCSTVYSALEVQHLRSRDHRFVCSFCCPANDFRTVKSEPSFTLVSVAVESNSKAMERKLVSQLSAASAGEPPREGILELLKELRGCPLIHNRPAVAISYLSHLLRLDYGRTTKAGG